jgi:hypothetical protein
MSCESQSCVQTPRKSTQKQYISEIQANTDDSSENPNFDFSITTVDNSISKKDQTFATFKHWSQLY